jgi:hypothetical protein
MTKAITDATAGAHNGEGVVTVSEDRVSVVSSEVTADEFLDLIVEQTEEYPIAPGKHAVIRSLEYTEVKRIVAENKGNRDELELSALLVGTVFPKLTDEHLERLRRGKAGPLMNMAKRIMEISGMVDSDKALGEDGASS